MSFEFSHKEGMKILESLPRQDISKVMWGLPSQTFHPVTMVMQSPNYWNGGSVGESYIRDKLREVSFDRKIIPPPPPSRGEGSGDFLSLFSDSLVKVVEIEPESRAMAITFRGSERGAPIKKG